MTDVRNNLLRELLEKIAIEQKYDNPTIVTSAIPTTGANFSSQLFHGTIKSKDKKDLNIFANAALFSDATRKQANSKDFFGLEPHFYTRLGKAYREIEEKNGVAEEYRIVIPKLYGYSDVYLKEIIVLQDLSKDGFVTWDRMKSIDWEYASKAIEELAKFHALSFAHQKVDPEGYEEANKLFQNLIMEENGALMNIFIKSSEKVVDIIREKNKAKLQKFVYEIIEIKSYKKFSQLKKRSVMVHGDYRQSNLMHKVQEEGKLQVAIVDFQTMYQGSVTVDLLYFIFLGSDGKFRAQYYDQLIEHYYENLAAALRRLNMDPDKVFPRNEFDEELEEMLPFGLLMSCMVLPLVTIDLSHVAEKTVDGGFDSNGVNNMLDFMSNTNELCVQRLNEVVDDYVKWGVI